MDNGEGLMRALAKGLDDLFNETPSMDRDRPYAGQSHTDTGVRGKTEVRGVTFRDIRDCFVRAVIMAHPSEGKFSSNLPYVDEANKGVNAALCANDMFEMKGEVDWIAVSQCLSCEIEKIMGIFPNVPELQKAQS